MKLKLLFITLFIANINVFCQSSDTLRFNNKALSLLSFINDPDPSFYKDVWSDSNVRIYNDSIRNLYIQYAENSYVNRDTLMFLSISKLLIENNIKTKFSNEIFNIYFNENKNNKSSQLALKILESTKVTNKQAITLLDYCKVLNKNSFFSKDERIFNSFYRVIDFYKLDSLKKMDFISIKKIKSKYINKLNSVTDYNEVKNVLLGQNKNFNYIDEKHFIYNKNLNKHLITIIKSNESNDLKKRAIRLVNFINTTLTIGEKQQIFDLIINCNNELLESKILNSINISLDSNQVNSCINIFPKVEEKKQELLALLLTKQSVNKGQCKQIFDICYTNSDKYSIKIVDRFLYFLLENNETLDYGFFKLIFGKYLHLHKHFSHSFNKRIKLNKTTIDSILTEIDNVNNTYLLSIPELLKYEQIRQKQLEVFYNRIKNTNDSIKYPLFRFIYSRQKDEIISFNIAIDSIIERSRFRRQVRFNDAVLNNNQIDRILFSNTFNKNKKDYLKILYNQELDNKQISFILKIIQENNDIDIANISFFVLKNSKMNIKQFDVFYNIFKEGGIGEKFKKKNNIYGRTETFRTINMFNYYSKYNDILILPYLINDFIDVNLSNTYYGLFYNKIRIKKRMYECSVKQQSQIEFVRLLQLNENSRTKGIDILSKKSENEVLDVLDYISFFFNENKDILNDNSKIYLSNLVKDVIENTKWNKTNNFNKFYNILKYNNNESILLKYKSVFEKCKDSYWCVPVLLISLGVILYLVLMLVIIFKKDSTSFENIIIKLFKLDNDKIKFFSIGFYFFIKHKYFIKLLLRKNTSHLLSDISNDEINFIDNRFFPDILVEDMEAINKPIDYYCKKYNSFFLIGKSGTGKSTILKKYVLDKKVYVSFIKASYFKDSLVKTIYNKVEGLLKNEKYIEYILINGHLQIFFDGLNELSPSNQDTIISEIEGKKFKRIIISTQNIQKIKDKKNKVFVKGVTLDAVKPFLLNYNNSTNYSERLEDFLLKAMEEKNIRKILRNPMDLSIIANLLNSNAEIISNEIYNQYSSIIISDFNETYSHRSFNTVRINEIAYNVISNNNIIIPTKQIGSELKTLLKYKMVNKREFEIDSKIIYEWFFRHDKITAFFASQYLANKQDLRLKHIEDINFKNTYYFLAESLPLNILKEDINKIRKQAMHSDIKDNTSILESIYQKRKTSR